jgi:hypothetical protein
MKRTIAEKTSIELIPTLEDCNTLLTGTYKFIRYNEVKYRANYFTTLYNDLLNKTNVDFTHKNFVDKAAILVQKGNFILLQEYPNAVEALKATAQLSIINSYLKHFSEFFWLCHKYTAMSIHRSYTDCSSLMISQCNYSWEHPSFALDGIGKIIASEVRLPTNEEITQLLMAELLKDQNIAEEAEELSKWNEEEYNEHLEECKLLGEEPDPFYTHPNKFNSPFWALVNITQESLDIAAKPKYELLRYDFNRLPIKDLYSLLADEYRLIDAPFEEFKNFMLDNKKTLTWTGSNFLLGFIFGTLTEKKIIRRKQNDGIWKFESRFIIDSVPYSKMGNHLYRVREAIREHNALSAEKMRKGVYKQAFYINQKLESLIRPVDKG